MKPVYKRTLSTVSPGLSARKAQAGFTLIELLTVVAIIGILAAIIIPTVGAAQAKAKEAGCASNLRQIHGGVMLYGQDNRGCLPLVAGAQSWANALQTYINAAATADSKEEVTVFACGSDDIDRTNNQIKACSYGLNAYVHVGGDVTIATQKRFTRITNPAQTVLVGDAWGASNTVVQAASLSQFPGDFHRGHHSNYVYADGHVGVLKVADMTVVDADTGRAALLYIPD